MEKRGSGGKGKNKIKGKGMKIKKETLLCNPRQTKRRCGTTSGLMK
jgi:hypothetical protein